MVATPVNLSYKYEIRRLSWQGTLDQFVGFVAAKAKSCF